MSYKVNRRDTVEPTISFACTHCRGGLKAPLTDAGSEHACPTCQVVLIVPAEEELKNWLDERLAIAAQAEQHTAESQNEAPVDTPDDSTSTEPTDPFPIPADEHPDLALIHKLLKFQAEQLEKQTELAETMQKDVRWIAGTLRVVIGLLAVSLAVMLFNWVITINH